MSCLENCGDEEIKNEIRMVRKKDKEDKEKNMKQDYKNLNWERGKNKEIDEKKYIHEQKYKKGNNRENEEKELKINEYSTSINIQKKEAKNLEKKESEKDKFKKNSNIQKENIDNEENNAKNEKEINKKNNEFEKRKSEYKETQEMKYKDHRKEQGEKDYEDEKIGKKDEYEETNLRNKEKVEKNIKEVEDSEKKYQEYGFKNTKNNCYLNSSLQLLTRVKGLKEAVLNNKDKNGNKITGGKLFDKFKRILQDIQNNEKTITPDYLKKEMGRIDNRYIRNDQEDANEFISNFLDALCEETSNKNCINRQKKIYDLKANFNNLELEEAYGKFYNKFYERKGYSFLMDLFYGNYITEKSCKECGKSSFKFNAFNMIELPIYDLAQRKKKYSSYAALDIKEILESNFSESKIYGAKCDRCGGDIYSRASIYKLPENLIVFFGRTANKEYIDITINYSRELDLYDYLYDKQSSKNYSLDCIIEHSGCSESGHYIAICQIKPDIWYYFSDSFYHEESPSFSSSNAIILLYKSKY